MNIISYSVSRLFSLLCVANSIVLSASTPAATPQATAIEEEDKTPLLQTSYHKVTSNAVRIHLVSFDSRNCALKVIDQASGPASQWSSAASLGKSKCALACINAGFFNPDGSPLGLVIDAGKTRGSINNSSLGAGFFYSNGNQLGIARKA
ncbi:MAG: hypothetical protein ABGY95_01305, partial [Rubritalea sp.]